MIEYRESKKIINSNSVVLFNEYLVNYFSVIVMFIVILIIAFGYFGLLSPKYENIIKNNQEYRLAKEAESEQLKFNILAYNNYKHVFDNINENDKNKIDNFLPGKNDSEELLIYMRDLVTRTGFRLESLSIDALDKVSVERTSDVSAVKKIDDVNAIQSEKIKNVNEIGITMQISGVDYQAIKSFIYNLERDSRFFDVNNINFSLSAKTLNLTLKTYYLK